MTKNAKGSNKLNLTNIYGIDKILEYYKNMAEGNNVDINFRWNDGVKYIINSFLTETNLEILIGDLIKNIFSNYTSDIFITKYYTDMQETTYKELVFENGKLIYAVGDPNDMEDDIVDGKEENEQTESNTSNENEPNNEINFSENSAIQEETTIVSSLENTGTQEITTAEKNDNKLPQTGTEEDNKFTKWLTAVISLGIFWLISMLLIDYKKEKINQSQKGGKHNGSR